FLGFIIIVFLGQLFITLLLLISREKIGQTLDQSTDQIIRQYGDGSGDNRLMDSDSQDRLMDKIQTYDECCGRTGPADWLKNSYIRTLNLTEPDVLPCSCFRSFKRSGNSPWCSELQNFTAPLYGRANGTFEEGCKTKINDWLQKNTLFIVSMDVSGLLIE
ncbi:leukocyte antigen CD37-like, partial [Plectropomus leopardus]|uniref:leukocyte antigen CD37-like n=1 Tax=Plectropomus leopardus TaxID=160734 RepID=UPI001C4CFD18